MSDVKIVRPEGCCDSKQVETDWNRHIRVTEGLDGGSSVAAFVRVGTLDSTEFGGDYTQAVLADGEALHIAGLLLEAVGADGPLAALRDDYGVNLTPEGEDEGEPVKAGDMVARKGSPDLGIVTYRYPNSKSVNVFWAGESRVDCDVPVDSLDVLDVTHHDATVPDIDPDIDDGMVGLLGALVALDEAAGRA